MLDRLAWRNYRQHQQPIAFIERTVVLPAKAVGESQVPANFPRIAAIQRPIIPAEILGGGCARNKTRSLTGHVKLLLLLGNDSREAAQKGVGRLQIAIRYPSLATEIRRCEGMGAEVIADRQVGDRIGIVLRKYCDPLHLHPKRQGVISSRPTRIVLPRPRVSFSA